MNVGCFASHYIGGGLLHSRDNQKSPFETLERWFDQSPPWITEYVLLTYKQNCQWKENSEILVKCCSNLQEMSYIWFHLIVFLHPGVSETWFPVKRRKKNERGVVYVSEWLKMLSNMEGMWNALTFRREASFLGRTGDCITFDSPWQEKGKQLTVLQLRS